MTIPGEQAATAELLRRMAGRPPIETHISAVFVGADTVWKLRKTVRLSFLDFSRAEERGRTARRELELNAPFAPGLYRDVVAVTRAQGGAVCLAGEGEEIDWVLRMNRVPEADFLDRVADRGDLTPELLDAIGDGVAAAHARLPPVYRPMRGVMADVAEGNAAASRAAGLAPTVVAEWLGRVQAAIAARAAWMQARSDAGFVRRAHGDLHLGNMCLWQGRPVPFDALEFDEELATIDLGYDLAFLLMDLEFRAGRAAANRVMNRYCARTGDWDLAPGLPVFLSLRAMIRAHVAASGGDPAQAQAYLGRALAYLDPEAPVLVAIGGLQGAGKSTLARALAPALGAAPGAMVLRSDEIRKRQHGVAPEQKLPQHAYSAAASRAVFAELCRTAASICAAGHAAIADATFLDPATRRQIAASAGTGRFLGVWLQAELAVLEARVAGRHGDASDADIAVLRRAAAADPGALDWLAVDATDATAALHAVHRALPGKLPG